MKVALHQPNYLPWLGFFHKLFMSDVFVILDDVDYQYGNSSSVTNRTKLKNADGSFLISVPVLHRKNEKQINVVHIDYSRNWQRKHLNSLRFSYSRAKYFDEVFALFEPIILSGKHEILADLNVELIYKVCEYLDIDTKIICLSELEIDDSRKTERIMNVCKFLGAKTYLSGKGGMTYLDHTLLLNSDIDIEVSTFQTPIYDQLFGPFIQNLSIVDALFNCGKGSIELISHHEPVRAEIKSAI